MSPTSSTVSIVDRVKSAVSLKAAKFFRANSLTFSPFNIFSYDFLIISSMGILKNFESFNKFTREGFTQFHLSEAINLSVMVQSQSQINRIFMQKIITLSDGKLSRFFQFWLFKFSFKFFFYGHKQAFH